MPIRLLNDRYLPVEKFDPAVHPVAAITGSSVLETGIDAWVELQATQPSLSPGIVRRLFRVPIRALRPGPTLSPRDPDVMAWIRRWDAADGLTPAEGWEASVEVAEQRWFGRTEPEAMAKIQVRLAEKRQETARLDAQDEAARPSLLDEIVGRGGSLVEDIKDVLGGVARVIKWSVVGAGAVVGLFVVARVVETVRES